MNYSDILSLSTSWNIRRHTNGKDLVDEITDLGFRKLELNYNVTREMAEEILPMVDKGRIEITSIHNVFPKIYDESFGTDSLLLGYPDPSMRAKAVELTIGAVEYAARFNAPAVVIHPGEVPVPRDYNRLLEDMLLDGRKDTEEYRALYKEMIELRSSGSPAYVELIRQSLEQICDYIEKKNYKVALGLENRTRCYQIPVFQEVHTLLKGLEGLPVYFWYDVGHGMLLEQMGMFDNYEEAEQLVERTIGAHIHDIIDCSDHFCPYQYSDKLDKYLDIIGQIPIKVLELGRDCKPDEICRSAEILAEKLSKISKGSQ
jgi:sugar phosphate isomerase/epimerase